MLIFTSTVIWKDSFGFELSLVKLNLSVSSMTHTQTAKHVKNNFRTIWNWKKIIEKSWKKDEKKVENYNFFEDFFGKTALNRGLALFSAVLWGL